jgi:hypothetical protein
MAKTFEANSMISKLQFHYWFSDKSHTMDALVHNKCERELLELTKVIAKVCTQSIKMEIEPSGKGGLKSWLTLTAKSPRKTPATKMIVLNILVAASVVTPHEVSIREIADQLFDSMLGNKEGGEVENEQLTKELIQLKVMATNIIPFLDQNSVVKKRRSNFYDLLRKYQKVKSVSVTLTDDAKKPVTEEQFVARDAFKSFIINSDTVAKQIVENAQIEIISPVLVSGRHKWKGMYNAFSISFIMKSEDFMSMVQSGKVEFKSGSTITCTLEVEKKINSTGVERIINYNILSVNSYSENGKTIETVEAKQKQKQNAASKRQLDLFA